MQVKKAVFLKSMRHMPDYPGGILPEIAVAGRSNSGKSTLINHLANMRSLAKVSSIPGKTRLVNFFKFTADIEFLLADLPGYGYAKVPKKEKDEWKGMIDEYFSVTRQLKAMLILMDIRRKPGDYDKQMLYFAQYYCIPFIIVATKADKIAKSKRKQYIDIIMSELAITASIPAVAFSAPDNTGKEELLDHIYDYIKA